MATTVDKHDLVKLLGRHIKDICPNGYGDNGFNHCAHFVSHFMRFTFGTTCKGQTGKGETGACLRVQEIFPNCPEVGIMAERKAATPCLAFVLEKGNVHLKSKVMVNVPKKHVGILCDGSVFHYSNKQHKVIQEPVAAFKNHYHGKHITVFYGTFPVG